MVQATALRYTRMQAEKHHISLADMVQIWCRQEPSTQTGRLSSTATKQPASHGFSSSCRPAQRLSGFRGGDLCGGNLVREELVEGLRDLLRGACLDDAPVREAVAQELGEAPGPREADVVGQPQGLFLESWRKRLVHDEAWVRRFALDAMQRALLPGQHGQLRPGDRDGRAARRWFERPGDGPAE